MNHSIIVSTPNEVEYFDAPIARLPALPELSQMGEVVFVDDGPTACCLRGSR
jgi:hypothetical protein